MIRINPEWPQNPGWEAHTVSIRANAEEALLSIDVAIKAL